ncbi:hypothetical protein H0H92_000076 [Tricholoma furcatifolium]|nr:hypothetical protein H0H92_000076 [Tricholoma furcatifolium]
MSTVATDNADWLRVSSGPASPFSIFTKPIQKSEQDDREYRLIRLDNGLQATLIHDANADKAAASLDVAVGHLYDPDDMPGLAHFCEHLLFMGTEQFPKENEYSEYLSKNNGHSNAYTSTSNTNYYFNVATPALAGALERFAGFFHSPLFAPSCTTRELNAVDSEHKKNHQADMWRIFQLNKHLSKEGHPWNKFGSGNKESLSKAAKALKAKGLLAEDDSVPRSTSIPPSPIPSRIASPAPSVASSSSDLDADGGAVGRETRRRLLEWWTKEYCASRMRLCIIGKESLDELSQLTSTLFSPIPNRGRDALPMIPDHPFGPNEKGTLVSVQTVMSFHALEISFPLDWQPPLWKHKPAHFLSHFLGHEGPGSLHSYLKKKGWVTTLSSGPQNLARGFGMFKVTIHLTEDGFRNYRDIIHAAFQYLSLLRASKFDAFHQREIANVSNIRFRFKEKRRPEEYATYITEHMAWPVPRELILKAPEVTWEWDSAAGESEVRKYLDSLRITEGRVVLMAPKAEHDKVAPAEVPWEKEPWYGTNYRVERFDEQFIEKAQGPNKIPELFLPGPNEFIPMDLQVDKRVVAEPQNRPHLIRETPLSTLWHKKDDRFFVPKAHAVIDIRSPIGNETARAAVMTKLYADIVNDSLTEYSYDADLAGLTYNFMSHTSGLYISTSGYNDKLGVLVRKVIETMKAVHVNPQRLAVIKEQNEREWRNFFLGQSYSLSDYFGRYLLTAEQWTLEERLEQLPCKHFPSFSTSQLIAKTAITAEEVQAHVKHMLSQVNLRILVAGNIYKDSIQEAMKIADIAEDGLGISPLSPIELNDRALILPDGSNHVWTCPIPNPNQANSALTYYVHYGPIADVKLRVVSSLLTQILSEPAFNILRTQEQLGYVVHCSPWLLAGSSEKGMRIVVQSEKTPAYLEERVESFLDGMKSTIENMSDAEFAEQKSGLEKKWLEKDKNLADETSYFIGHITTGHWDFLRRQNDARSLETVTKGDVLQLFLSRVHPSSATRSKLSIHMVSQKPRPKKVSVTASQEFAALLREAGVEVDSEVWKESLGADGTPLATDFANYWRQVLDIKDTSSLLDALPELVEKYPIPGEGKVIPRCDVTHIKDLKAFKAGLTYSVDPGPMAQWGDLPVSRI